MAKVEADMDVAETDVDEDEDDDDGDDADVDVVKDIATDAGNISLVSSINVSVNDVAVMLFISSLTAVTTAAPDVNLAHVKV